MKNGENTRKREIIKSKLKNREKWVDSENPLWYYR